MTQHHMTLRHILILIGLLTATVTTSSLTSASNSSEPLNVLLITSEDNGPELGCYGDPYAQTPHLDQMALEGVRFSRAYITNPVCSPSRGTIFTGLYPHQNGQIGLATNKYAMFKKWPNVVGLLKIKIHRSHETMAKRDKRSHGQSCEIKTICRGNG